MSGGDVILMARRRAGLTQRELADRLGCRQATIARWERGDRRPSFEDVQTAAGACCLVLDAHLIVRDTSWWPQIAVQLELPPLERVRRLSTLGRAGAVAVLEALAATQARVIVIGQAAGALHGWPLVLNDDDCVDVAVPGAAIASAPASGRVDTLDGVPDGRLRVIGMPAGTNGYSDLIRGAQPIKLAGGQLRVAGLLDLLRIADASPDAGARRDALALQAVIDVQRQRARPRPVDPVDDDPIQAWLARQTPLT